MDNDLIGLLLFPILVGLVIPYLLIGVLSSGVVIQNLTAGLSPDWFPAVLPDGRVNQAANGGLPPALGSLMICTVVLIYVFFGGMRGTAWANAFQTVVFMILGVVTFYVIANRLGGEENFVENLKKLGAAVPESHATRVEMSKTKFFTYLLIPIVCRYVSASLSTLDDRQERQYIQSACCLPSDLYHDRLGALRIGRSLGGRRL